MINVDDDVKHAVGKKALITWSKLWELIVKKRVSTCTGKRVLQALEEAAFLICGCVSLSEVDHSQIIRYSVFCSLNHAMKKVTFAWILYNQWKNVCDIDAIDRLQSHETPISQSLTTALSDLVQGITSRIKNTKAFGKNINVFHNSSN